MAPKVSVVIPTHNRQYQVVGAIHSALSQSYPIHEVIVVDDGSTDQTERVIRSLNNKDIKYYRLKNNKGAAAARNLGIDAASGEYVAFLDSDDRWCRKKVEKQTQRLVHDEADICYSGYIVWQDCEALLGSVPKHKGNITAELRFRDVVGPTSVVMASKESLGEVDGFDETLDARQDYELWLRLSRIASFTYVREPLVYILRRGAGITSDFRRRFKADREVCDRVRGWDWLEADAQVMSSHLYQAARALHRADKFWAARQVYRSSLSKCLTNYKAWIGLWGSKRQTRIDRTALGRLWKMWKTIHYHYK